MDEKPQDWVDVADTVEAVVNMSGHGFTDVSERIGDLVSSMKLDVYSDGWDEAALSALETGMLIGEYTKRFENNEDNGSF